MRYGRPHHVLPFVQSMDKAGLGAAIVTDNKHNVMGIITERDYMSKVIVKV